MHPRLCHPILAPSEAAAFEKARFEAGSDHEAAAMERAAIAAARCLEQSLGERFAPDQTDIPVMVLIGRGHNGGDACLTAHHLATRNRSLHFYGVLLDREEEMRPLTRTAFQRFCWSAPRLTLLPPGERRLALLEETFPSFPGIVIDGWFGFQFRPPLREPERTFLRWLNHTAANGFRLAIDLPSGIGDPDAFVADMTVATGILKTPLLEETAASCRGRVRYADIGFFDTGSPEAEQLPPPRHLVIAPGALDPLRRLRPQPVDKRDFGKIGIAAGSDSMPGALQMATRAALRAGGGLVTGFSTPAAIAAAASACPEAMWHPLPVTPPPALPVELDSLLIGPGTGWTTPTAIHWATLFHGPLVVDADAIRPGLVEARREAGIAAPTILTPHEGELARLFGGSPPDLDSLAAFCRRYHCIVVRKGAFTSIHDGAQTCWSPHGGPLLARGGSGDCLAGVLAAVLGRFPDPLAATIAAVAWTGAAADHCAASHGAEGLVTTRILDSLGPALRQRSLAQPMPIPTMPL